jgi:hypothetical protein
VFLAALKSTGDRVWQDTSEDAGHLVAVEVFHKAAGLGASLPAHHHHLQAAHKEVAGVALGSKSVFYSMSIKMAAGRER